MACANSSTDWARMMPSNTRPISAAVFQNERVFASAHPVVPLASQRNAVIGEGMPTWRVRYTVVDAVAYTGGAALESCEIGLSVTRYRNCSLRISTGCQAPFT